MVATWNPAASSSYYTRRTEYYLGDAEPAGVWYAPAGDFGLVDGAQVERGIFEQLYNALDADGRPLLDKIRRHRERTSAFDVTLSAPRSVSLIWGLATPERKRLIEAAQQRAVRATLSMLEREATWARRGRNGMAGLEKVPLTAATFVHGASRPARHADGRVFEDPNLHTHCVCMNISTRQSDGTVGGLHSKVIRDWKMAAGATYHAALAHELMKLGFDIDRVGKNGIFEVATVDDAAIKYFGARRRQIEDELAEHGVVSAQAPALAAAITKATRNAKRESEAARREDVWREAAEALGVDTATFTESLRDPARTFDREAAEQLLSERLNALPVILTERESVIERRELVRSVTAALVGTGLPAERAQIEVDRMLRSGAVVEIGRDSLGLPSYSTPEMIAIEREVVTMAQDLASRTWQSVDLKQIAERCATAGLSAEQTEAVLSACKGNAITIIEGAPGSGKTTTLTQIVAAHGAISSEAVRSRGGRRDHGPVKCVATATAWRIANTLASDLGIESRATASWIAMLKAGHNVFDENTLLVVDEAGLLSSRDMHVLLSAVKKAGAKAVLVGDRRQLQPIGGPGLDLVSRAVEAARVDNIVRQREAWARDAITAFGQGQAAAGLEAFAAHGLLVEAQGAKAAIAATLDAADEIARREPNGSILILAKSNAAVAAISRAARERHRTAGLIKGEEVSLMAATPSGHATQIALATGDKIRFLVRNDELGVINGTTATILAVGETPARFSDASRIRIEADVGGRRITFDPMCLADAQGRPRLGWAYASTIYGSQGLTVDSSVVYIDHTLSRHDIFVASSRARGTTTLVVDSKSIDRHLASELPFDRQDEGLIFSEAQRRGWLAERLSRASPKVSTLDVIEGASRLDRKTEQLRERPRELSHEL